MNKSQPITSLTIKVPVNAIHIIEQLAVTLCNAFQSSSADEDEWEDSIPLKQDEKAGILLRAARLRADITQQDLAEKIGVPQAHISQYEKNKRKIPKQKAEQLATILNTSPKYFM